MQYTPILEFLLARYMVDLLLLYSYNSSLKGLTGSLFGNKYININYKALAICIVSFKISKRLSTSKGKLKQGKVEGSKVSLKVLEGLAGSKIVTKYGNNGNIKILIWLIETLGTYILELAGVEALGGSNADDFLLRSQSGAVRAWNLGWGPISLCNKWFVLKEPTPCTRGTTLEHPLVMTLRGPKCPWAGVRSNGRGSPPLQAGAAAIGEDAGGSEF
ncbi:hypothetical protein B0T21DRAFT_353231 [Apiosordaria backusii]|uniref:Uncharacterized protein n=1 Tax=Apiosordaria backusii TaxID=314023 RepID=A0AA40DIC7_9PEZI|nr:hypothetical protein B0T21DRAFT_353231 [Apiosordaria backusii]